MKEFVFHTNSVGSLIFKDAGLFPSSFFVAEMTRFSLNKPILACYR